MSIPKAGFSDLLGERIFYALTPRTPAWPVIRERTRLKKIIHPWVHLDTFEVDPTIQPRTSLTRDAVRRYAMVYRSDPDGMPPITLGQLPDRRTILVDGFHRVEAARQVGQRMLRAETVETTIEVAPWLAVDANVRNGVPIPSNQKREVFKRFVTAGRNRLPDGGLMSSRAIAAALKMGSHTSMLNYMKQYFPAIHAEMLGRGEEEIEDYEGDPVDHLREQALNDLGWHEKQLRVAIAKARQHVPGEELAMVVRGAVVDFEKAVGRPLMTIEDGLNLIHGRQPEEDF